MRSANARPFLQVVTVGLLRALLLALLAVSLTLPALPAGKPTPQATGKPNILLVILEDWGPYLGCYGVKEVATPNLDQLASEGCLFKNCYSMGPVCSTGRSSLMTGLSQYTIHAQQHRTAEDQKQALPPGVKSLPEIFRDAGYFTALGCSSYHHADKIDLNFRFPRDEIYLGKDWTGRNPGQPFFAHLSLTETHRPWRHDPGHPVDPAKVTLPSWYPDTPMTRADWAMGLESAQIDDRHFGELIDRLKKEGLYDNTIIVVTADHGIALPRGKQFLYSEGLHIPLLIRCPASIKPGTVEEGLVSNIDIAPTVLGLAGLPIPPTMQGRNILDPSKAPRRFVFAGRDKMDDSHDASRAVRSQDYAYILNLMPERPYAQYNRYKEANYPGLALLNVLHHEGKLPPVQDAFMQPSKPAEELYDLRKDPDEIHNLAHNPAHASVLKEMQEALREWRESVGDPGVSEEFRHTGWPATYPTRPLSEWKTILADWENHILHGGAFPKIPMPPEFKTGSSRP